jgi:GT2 family glycosyltransferase
VGACFFRRVRETADVTIVSAPHIAILIPTHGRPDKLLVCLEHLARQTMPRDQFEVFVGFDGGAADDVEFVRDRMPRGLSARLFAFEHAGPGQTRNRLVAQCDARADVLLMLNDDVLPAPDLLHHHAAAHARDEREQAMFVGRAPWRTPAPAEDTFFDRLVRETSLIFFYDRMDAALSEATRDADAGAVVRARRRDWGFRHAWTLNFSMPRVLFDRCGGFDARLRFPAYEDLEMARRATAFGTGGTAVPVRYVPDAVVVHDHRLTPRQYLSRERMLGKAAYDLARAVPDCAREVFGRDILSRGELAYAQEFCDREHGSIERVRATFLAHETVPASAGDTPGMLHLAYEHHLPLKRWEWRQGLLDAARSCHESGSTRKIEHVVAISA